MTQTANSRFLLFRCSSDLNSNLGNEFIMAVTEFVWEDTSKVKLNVNLIVWLVVYVVNEN